MDEVETELAMKPCPFCGEIPTKEDFVYSKHWTGMRYVILQTHLHHHCKSPKGSRFLKLSAKTEKEVIALWDKRNCVTEDTQTEKTP